MSCVACGKPPHGFAPRKLHPCPARSGGASCISRTSAPTAESALRGEPDFASVKGTAEATGLADRSVSLVTCAQAFHWFSDQAALAEIHRVLRPGGRLALVWNVRDESVDWVRALTGIMAPYEGGTPRYHSGNWRLPFDGRLFTGLEETCFQHQHVGDPQAVIVDRTLSVSFIANLPEAERAGVKARLLDLIASHPELRDRESIAFPYLTHAFRCTKVALTAS